MKKLPIIIFIADMSHDEMQRIWTAQKICTRVVSYGYLIVCG
jgi:hypothetical protein